MNLDDKEAISEAKVKLSTALLTCDAGIITQAISDAQAVFSGGAELDAARLKLKNVKIKGKLSLANKKRDCSKIVSSIQECSKLHSSVDTGLRQLICEEIALGFRTLKENGVVLPDIPEEVRSAVALVDLETAFPECDLRPSLEERKDSSASMRRNLLLPPETKERLRGEIEKEILEKESQVKLLAGQVEDLRRKLGALM